MILHPKAPHVLVHQTGKLNQVVALEEVNGHQKMKLSQPDMPISLLDPQHLCLSPITHLAVTF